MKPLEKAIELGGGLSEFAKKIDAAPNQVNNWRTRGVPVEFCAAIELAVDGKVTRKDLCPDGWEKIWPELAGPTDAAQSEGKTNQEMRRETDLGYRQPANSKQVDQ